MTRENIRTLDDAYMYLKIYLFGGASKYVFRRMIY